MPSTRDVKGEFGDSRIVELTSAQRDEITQVASKNPTAFRATLFALSLIDDDGRRMFDAEKDIAAIKRIPTGFTEPIIDAAIEFNKMGVEAKEAEKKDSSNPETRV